MQLQWTIHYDVAALAFIGILVLFYVRGKHVATIQNRLFVVISFVMLGATALDILTAFTLSSPFVVPLALNSILNTLCLLNSQILPILLLFYLLTTQRVYNSNNKRWIWMYCLPTIPMMALIIASPFTGQVFYFDEQLRYMHGPLWPYMFAPCVFTAVLSVIYIIKYWRNLTPMQNMAALSFDLLIGFAMLLQIAFFEWVLLTYFFMSLSLFVIYMALQRQEYHIHKSTGILNAEAFLVMYEECIRLKRSNCVAVFEVQDMQHITSLCGPELSRALLSGFYQALSSSFQSDSVFMVSNSRFIVLYRQQHKAGLSRAMEALRSGWMIDGKCYSLSCKAAIFSNHDKMPEPKDILTFIDIVSVIFKQNGDFDIIEIGDSAYDKLNRYLAVQRALHKAIDDQTLNAHYQPIYDAKSGHMKYIEVLARLENAELGVVPAFEFIDIAERDGSIASMTTLLFERACKTAKRIADIAPDIEGICFNLSAAQLLQSHLADNLLSIADKYSIPFSRFVFELTETEPVTKTGQIGYSLERLLSNGARMALDDFGTGYSNLRNVMDISFSIVKIDKSLVHGYVMEGHGFLKHLCDLFHDAGIMLIAEGIEEEMHVDALTHIGCDMLQGYYLSRPLTDIQLTELLSRNRY